MALLVNGAPAGTLTSSECRFRTCAFRNVALKPGRNVVVARRSGGGAASSDEVEWTSPSGTDVNVAAGQIATGLRTADGRRYGSDNFFTGGEGRKVVQRAWRSAGDVTPIRGLRAYRTLLTRTLRVGVRRRKGRR